MALSTHVSGPIPGINTIDVTGDPSLTTNSPIVALGLKTWNRLRGERSMPSPEDIDPLRIPKKLLSHILLLDVEYRPEFRLRWRLIGTHVTDALGRDSTGCYWDELYTPYAMEKLAAGPRWVIENRRPIRVLGDACFVDKSHIHSESIDLPFSVNGDEVSRIMVVTEFSPRHHERHIG